VNPSLLLVVVKPTSPTPTTIDFGALSVCLVVAAPALAALASAFRARDVVHRLYAEERARARAAIEATRIVPELSKLVTDIGPITMDPDSPQTEGDIRRAINDALESIDYLPGVTRLSEYAADHRELDLLPTEAIRWAHRKGWAAGIFLIGFAFSAYWVSLVGDHPPRGLLVPSLIIAALGGAFSVTSWLQEVQSRNGLVTILDKYRGGSDAG
jgi:hypothetical protein